jgi:predicted DNA binding CopG/RHH family protein
MTNKSWAEMTGAELAAASDEIEAEMLDSTKWVETEESKARAPEREAWAKANTTSINIRMPNDMLDILKAIAEREHVGYQTLMKQWLRAGIEQYAKNRRPAPQPAVPAPQPQAAIIIDPFAVDVTMLEEAVRILRGGVAAPSAPIPLQILAVPSMPSMPSMPPRAERWAQARAEARDEQRIRAEQKRRPQGARERA